MQTETGEKIMNNENYIQGYSRVIMRLTKIETQPVIHCHELRGSFMQGYSHKMTRLTR
jgi:hypothetical protein